jgi:hypothetical protein
MRILLLAIVAAVVAAEGYVHGLWTQRWQNSPELTQAVARLDLMPLTVGNWRGTESRKLKDREIQLAGFAGYVQRRYERPDGATVSVLLACGRAGPLSVHTPEVCYAGAGFEAAGDPARESFQTVKGSGPTEFWKAKFTKPGTGQHLRVFWSWRARGGWLAADSPRLTFAGLPALHKMYVVCELATADARQEDAACAEFMALLLPELDRTVFAIP